MIIPELQARIARFCADRCSVSAASIEKAAGALVDTLSVAIAARNEPISQAVLKYAGLKPVGGVGSIWAADASADEETAALVNGTMAHALDYDDVAPDWRGHPSTVLFPTLFAVGAQIPLLALLEAYTIGYAVGGMLGDLIGDDHYKRGWHATATIGIIAAVAAAGRAVGLSELVIQHALGLAVSHASGVRANFGSMVKPLHAGMAASAAVRCISLAQLGVTSSPNTLGDARGFLALHSQDGTREAPNELRFDPNRIARLEGKLFPTCYATHRALTAAIDLAATVKQSAVHIDSVEVVGTPNSHVPLIRKPPVDATEARFSMEYCVASALTDGEIGLVSFEPPRFSRSAVKNLCQRIEVAEAPLRTAKRGSRVTVVLSNGRRMERLVEDLVSLHERSTLARKRDDCFASAGLDETKAGDLSKFMDEAIAAKEQVSAGTLASGLSARMKVGTPSARHGIH
jgi:2-methylcitrate dehydratase PrpD